jgi:hypothetical protein
MVSDFETTLLREVSQVLWGRRRLAERYAKLSREF